MATLEVREMVVFDDEQRVTHDDVKIFEKRK